MPGYWFFLSYATLDRDEYLRRFYENLVSTVRLLGGLVEKQIGFYAGKDIEPGDEWPQDLAEGLGTSRVFVSLYSPTYFDREYCGKEWQVFRSRLEAHATAGQRPPLIMPVLWVPLDNLSKTLPDAISNIQYKHDDFGDEYAKVGLRQLMALNRHRDRYKEFLVAFANKLIQAAKQHPLQPMLNLRPIK